MDKPLAPLLIVDDEPSVLSALKRELRDVAPVFTAQSPDEALTILNKNTVGVVVSDYKMPNKDGVTFLSELKDLPYEPVKILMTAFSDPDIAVDAINRAGIFYFLKKPWNSAELKVLMDRALEAFHNKNELKFCRQRLREIENIKNSITSLLTHELKTPLTTISGYTELLGRSVNDAELKNVINSLQGSVTKLEGFIDDTLYIAKIETGQVDLGLEKVDLKGILDKTLPVFEIKDAVSVESNLKLITESFFRISRYLSLQGGTLSGESIRSGNYLTLKLFIHGRSTKPNGNSQLALFQRLETNGDIMHYGSDASLDIIFASAVFGALKIGFNVTEMNDELRMEIIFNKVV
jgi:signal transduction histidine kinase